MSLNSTTFSAKVNGGETNTFGAVSVNEPVGHTTASDTAPVTNGSGNGQAQVLTSFTATVNNTGTTYDLTALVGGLNGANRNYTVVKGVIIENLDTTNNVVIGNAATVQATFLASPGTATTTIEPGGFVAWYSPNSGNTVSTNKNLLIKAAAATANIRVTILGLGT